MKNVAVDWDLAHILCASAFRGTNEENCSYIYIFLFIFMECVIDIYFYLYIYIHMSKLKDENIDSSWRMEVHVLCSLLQLVQQCEKMCFLF